MVEDKRQRLHFTVRVVRAVLNSGVRGSTRLALFSARWFRTLQSVPVATPSGAVFYLDLRLSSSHGLLTGRPVEQNEQNVMRRLLAPGDVAFDIGAHLGVHTVFVSPLVHPGGEVYAFEPNPSVIPVLERTVEGLSNATLLGIALSDRSAESVLHVPLNPSMASLRDWTRHQNGRSVKVKCEENRLDDLIQSSVVPRPDFIKCDVEGAELAVFHGARQALQRADAPIILFEVNANTIREFGLDLASATEFLRSLTPAGYRFFELTTDGTLEQIQAPRSAHANILAVPASRMNRCNDLRHEAI